MSHAAHQNGKSKGEAPMKRNASIATIQSSTPKPQTAKEVIAANVKALIKAQEEAYGVSADQSSFPPQA